jgi:hypothetical protein
MEYPISHPDFEGQNLVVRPAGPGDFSHHLLQNGAAIKKAKGVYSVKNNAGVVVPVKLKNDFLDPVPKVVIGNDIITLVPPLKWYEYVWAGIPLLLILKGGAVGGGIGAVAAFYNAKIFRGQQGNVAKYGFTALISVGAIVVYIILALILQATVFSKQS